jgi:hypothetical protein
MLCLAAVVCLVMQSITHCGWVVLLRDQGGAMRVSCEFYRGIRVLF